ncbi:hypothetical protein [Microbulbifer rhizosphaerae]|uniref:Amino acid permease n=1 Tax=Microbulbifer rhizosphaerae TaxID=1562603 RepID=A0A7W4Z8C9_9GAMM|nr:hypothetical protein [Microbulbifer rhizosphaerae]MBB3060673.1 amino acid permease [Microbulbifer rhizosphaerae]
MTKLILWFLALFILVGSLAILIKPELQRQWVDKLTGATYRFLAWMAVVIGLILLMLADTRSWVILFKVLGVIAVLKGAWLLQSGYPHGRDRLQRLVGGNDLLVRIVGGIGVLLALVLFSAS